MQRLSLAIATSAILLLSLSSLASGQTIQVGPSAVALSAPSGGLSQPSNVSVAVSSGSLAFTTSVNYSSGANWLQVTPASGTLTTTATTLSLTANALGLSANTYTAALVISGPLGTPFNTVAVTLTVGGSGGGQGTLTVSPASISLSDTAGLSTFISVNGPLSTPVVTFTATASTITGSGWLQVSPFVGQTPTNLLVSAITTGLANGTYQGSVTITPTSGTATTVPVTLTVGASSGGGGGVTPASFQFYGQPGGSIPAPQYLNIPNLGYSVTLTPTTSSGGNWLILNQSVTATPATIPVQASPASLAAGTYFGNIAVANQSNGSVVANIPVTFSVGTGTLLTVGPAPSTFSYTSGGSLPPAQVVSLGSSGAALSFSVTTSTTNGVNWLAVSPTAGTTPASLNVSTFPVNLPTGIYTGTITVTAPGAANSPQSFPVTLNVNNSTVASSLNVSPTALYFGYQIGGTNPVNSQSVSVTTPNTTSSITATPVTSSCGSNWLQVTSFASSTPTTLIVSINTTGLTTAQTCSGTINISASTIGASAQIPVTLTVATTSLLNISPAGLTFTAQYGSTSATPASISLSSTDNTPLTYTATPSSSGWLFVSPTSGTTPSAVTVSVSPTLLGPGTYTGSVTIQSPGLPSAVLVPVTLTITQTAALSASPTSLTFTQVQGAAAPAGQALTVSSGGGNTIFTATSSATWLTVTPSSGTTPATVTVTANGSGLTAGTYTGTITLTALGSTAASATVPVTLTVTSPVTISATPASLSFTAQTGGTAPAAQNISVSATPATALAFTTAVTVASGSGWLSATPASGTTPGTVAVSVNASSLTAGTYTGTVTITASATGSPISIPVTLTVQTGPSVTSVTNGASSQGGAIAPGEIITIKGTQLGPAAGVNFSINAAGKIDTTLSGVQVLFGTTAAPLLYVSATQINAIVPYEVVGTSTTLKVSYSGGTSSGTALQVAGSAPGIFTLNQSGSGPGAILNQDSSINTAANPAARGSIIQIFATGEGQTVPAGITGGITPITGTPPKPTGVVSVTVGGVSAQVVYFGAAPASVAGLFQVNVFVPNSVQSGNVPVVLTVGSGSSTSAATVAVQ